MRLRRTPEERAIRRLTRHVDAAAADALSNEIRTGSREHTPVDLWLRGGREQYLDAYDQWVTNDEMVFEEDWGLLEIIALQGGARESAGAMAHELAARGYMWVLFENPTPPNIRVVRDGDEMKQELRSLTETLGVSKSEAEAFVEVTSLLLFLQQSPDEIFPPVSQRERIAAVREHVSRGLFDQMSSMLIEEGDPEFLTLRDDSQYELQFEEGVEWAGSIFDWGLAVGLRRGYS